MTKISMLMGFILTIMGANARASVGYSWKKSSFGDGCVEIETDSKMFQILCKETFKSSEKIKLDCTKSPEKMELKHIEFFSSEKACEAGK